MLGVGCIRVFTSLIPAIDGTPNILDKPVNPHSEKSHSSCITVRGFQRPIAILSYLFLGEAVLQEIKDPS